MIVIVEKCQKKTLFSVPDAGERLICPEPYPKERYMLIAAIVLLLLVLALQAFQNIRHGSLCCGGGGGK